MVDPDHIPSLRAQRSNPEPDQDTLGCFAALATTKDAMTLGRLDHVGVTSNLGQQVWLHREGTVDGFTKRYSCKRLVWFGAAAITREKQIKGGSRQKKLTLIEAMNPGWHDLYKQIAHG